MLNWHILRLYSGSPQNQPGTVPLPNEKPLHFDPLLHLTRGGESTVRRFLVKPNRDLQVCGF
jgi:hypothetical protein